MISFAVLVIAILLCTDQCFGTPIKKSSKNRLSDVIAGHLMREKRDASFIPLMFRDTDVNNDGLISEQEFSTQFKHFDDDDDDTISQREYIRGFQRGRYGSATLGSLLFNMADINQNRIIDFDDLKEVMVRFDSNRDHRVTPREYRTKWTQILHLARLAGRK